MHHARETPEIANVVGPTSGRIRARLGALLLSASALLGCADAASSERESEVEQLPAAQQVSCRAGATQASPFGCGFAWGTDDNGKSPLGGLAGLQFVSKWVGYETTKDGTLPRCDGCTWLRDQVAKTQLTPVYYAYFVGFLGHANGLEDGNVNPRGPNLTTDATRLIREKREALIDMYASYARQSAAAYPGKPVVWLLEGDMVQYAGESQKQRFSYAELGQFAAEVSCAIKSNMPNAVVAINHSTWNPDQVTNDFWGAIARAGAPYDLVWTTGVPNNNGFLEKNANSGTYNAKTATYRYLKQLTGRGILVDTSFGLSAMADSWSTSSASTLNARIGEGVIAANVVGGGTSPAYAQRVRALAPQLSKVCK